MLYPWHGSPSSVSISVSVSIMLASGDQITNVNNCI